MRLGFDTIKQYQDALLIQITVSILIQGFYITLLNNWRQTVFLSFALMLYVFFCAYLCLYHYPKSISQNNGGNRT